MTYGESCSTYSCNPSFSLTCSSGTGTDCNCPTTYGGNTCDCDTTRYWNGTFCALRQTNGSFCTATKDYMCTYNVGLTCPSGTCICATTGTYWTGSVCR